MSTATTTSPRQRLLVAMEEHPNSTQAELALAAGMARSTASTTLAKLVAEGEAVRTEAEGKGAATYVRAASPEELARRAAAEAPAEVLAEVLELVRPAAPVTEEQGDPEVVRWAFTEAPEVAAPAEEMSDEEAERIMLAEAEAAEAEAEAAEAYAADPHAAEAAAMGAEPAALVEAVKAHAREHYTAGGWDVVVECWDDSEIARVLAENGATTVAEALDAFRPLVDVWADRQADAAVEGATEQGQAEAYLSATAEAAQREQEATAAQQAEAPAEEEATTGHGCSVCPEVLDTEELYRLHMLAKHEPARGTLRQLGIAVGDTVRLSGGVTGVVEAEGGVAYLRQADGERVRIGGFASKVRAALVSKAEAPAPAEEGAATGEAPAEEAPKAAKAAKAKAEPKAKAAKAKAEPKRKPLPEGYVSVVGLQHEINRRGLYKGNRADGLLTGQSLYTYIKANKEGSAHPFPIGQIDGQVAIDLEAGIAWWIAKNERVAAKEAARAAKAAKKDAGTTGA